MEWDWRFLADLQNVDIGAIIESFRTWLAARWGEVTIRVEAVRKVLDPVVWIVGSILALVPGSFAIYKWWYYHESRLPQRLSEFLAKEEIRLRTARNVLLKSIERPSLAKRFTAPIFLAPSLKEAMRNMRLARWWNVWVLASAEKSLETALAEIEKQMKFWDDQQAHYKRQEAAALLLRGAIAAGKGTVEDNKAALGYFLKALAIDESDVEALEYAAHQRRILGELDDALADYERLARLTKKPGAEAAEMRIRALRYQGEIYEKMFEKDGVRQDLAKGKNCLEIALKEMPAELRGELHHASIHEVLGRIEDKRGTKNLPSDNYRAAKDIYNDLIVRKRDLLEAEAGRERVQRLLRELQERSSRTEAPDAGPPQDVIA
jgi:tetratricopeptide (TPR) repeat protein